MNKLVTQQVKSVFQSMPQVDISRLLQILVREGIQKTFKQIGYKCVECSLSFKGINVSGFGRDDNEATQNSIKNLVDSLLEQDPNSLQFLRTILRELKLQDCDPDLEKLGQKIGNISIIQNQNNYQTVDSLVNCENDHSFLNAIKQNEVCKNCSHEQELRKEKLKVEHLELRIKLLLEENQILKTLVNDNHHNNNNNNNNNNINNNNMKMQSNRQHSSSRQEDTKRMHASHATRANSLKMRVDNLNSKAIPKLNLDVLLNRY